MMLAQPPISAGTRRCCCTLSTTSSSKRNPKSNPNHHHHFFSKPLFTHPRRPTNLTIANSNSPSDTTRPKTTPPPAPPDETVFVGDKGVPLEGVIQFDKSSTPTSSSSPLKSWGRVALLAGGDALFLLAFSSIGRFSHGFPVFDFETFRTADPFLAGWFLGAYFLGGYAEDGRGENGLTKAVVASAKSWAVGIPLGVAIRAATSGHIPPIAFVLVSMGSTAVLMIGWRTLLCSLLPYDQRKKNDVYRQGSPFELFELLTSLIRRW
ncbi:hypothetical protein QJS10_CPB13g00074 [Acorus calamus]|uniref:Transmembrane protein n=1 Tax=Acorus calamus TaxID=4465 RepID=A0AAV9DEW5_ACOCL|nr:hypothetical protein QJS10_CPB13g00074 [Acorus calamus]